MASTLTSIDTNQEVSFSFTTHGIGQGFFYSGSINNFHFVFDCGTSSEKPILSNKIQDVHEIKDNLDMLIISHFHNDHINGVTDLVGYYPYIQTVVLPYLHMEQRILVAAETALTEEKTILDDTSLTNILDFESLFSEETNFVYLIDQENEISEDGSEPGETTGWKGGIINENQQPGVNPKITPNRYQFRKSGAYFYNQTWKFRFYCKNPELSIQSIRTAFQSYGIDLTKSSSLIDFVKTNFEKIKDAYKHLIQGYYKQHSSCVVVCHGPIIKKNQFLLNNCLCSIQPSKGIYCCQIKKKDNSSEPFFKGTDIRKEWIFGHLLTGDINLTNVLLKNEFFTSLKHIKFTSLPHHGSDHNWKSDFLICCPKCNYWIASYGIKNSHDHPGPTVKKEIEELEKNLIHCNDNNDFTVFGHIHKSP